MFSIIFFGFYSNAAGSFTGKKRFHLNMDKFDYQSQSSDNPNPSNTKGGQSFQWQRLHERIEEREDQNQNQHLSRYHLGKEYG
jgi:hypothetical protein